jgi:transcriptional regulator with XRE-family HTH domain
MKKRPIHNRRKAFRAFMDARGLTPSDISRQTGVAATTIYSFLDGKSDSFTGRTEKKIADGLGITVNDLYQENKNVLVPLAGKIGAGAMVNPFDGETSTMGYVEPPPGMKSDGLEAFEIEGFSMPPFKPGHKVFINVQQIAAPESLIGEMCIAQIKNGPRYFKVLRRGYDAGHFNLESLAHGEPLIENVELDGVAKIIGASFT